MPLTDPSDKITIQCPQCGKTADTRVANIGRKVRCGCGNIYVAAQAGGAAAVATVALAPAEAPAPQSPLGGVGTAQSATSEDIPLEPLGPAEPPPFAPGTVAPVMGIAPAGAGAFPPGAASAPPMCRQHPQCAAIAYCTSCRAPICPTCAFSLPGGLHMCPDCAITAPRKLSGKRKTLVWISMAIAIWCTLATGFVMSGALAHLAHSEMDLIVLGLVVMYLIMSPSLLGLGLGIACFDRRLANRPIFWVATIWNGLLLGTWLVLCVIGQMK